MKYTHKVKVFHDKWMKKPQEVEVSLPYVPTEFVRPDEVVETFHIDWEEEKKKGNKKLPQFFQGGEIAMNINHILVANECK